MARKKPALKKAKAPAKKSAAKKKPATTQRLALAPPIKPIVAMLRKIIKESAPQAAEVLAGRGVSFEFDGVFARIEASDRKVLLAFVNGDSLEAPAGLLAGTGTERNLVLSDVDDVKENVLRGLVRQAVLKSVNASRNKRGHGRSASPFK